MDGCAHGIEIVGRLVESHASLCAIRIYGWWRAPAMGCNPTEEVAEQVSRHEYGYTPLEDRGELEDHIHMVIDPICRLTVDKSTERRAYFNGETVYFCSERCCKKFVSAPDVEKYQRTHEGSGAHSCAKHPELWQENPCDCPKCRIASESTAKPAETDGRERTKSHGMTARFRIVRAMVSQVMSGRGNRQGTSSSTTVDSEVIQMRDSTRLWNSALNRT